MAKSAFAGPIITYGQREPPGVGGTTNQDLGPGAIIGGNGWLDPRAGYNSTNKGWIGVGIEMRRVLSVIPATAGAANIAAAQNAVSGTAFTLAAASTGITLVPTGGVVVRPSNNLIPAGALVLDGLPALVNYGLADSNGNYNNNAYGVPSMLSRCVAITGATGGAGGNITVRGWDIYGYPMSQTIAATAGATTVASLKAFKFIGSITPAFSDAHNYTVGTTDVFGLPLKASFFHEALFWWNSTLITANTGFVAADATSPATATTGDVRGTYAVQSASDGTKRLAANISPSQATIATAAGLFGVTQA